MADTITPTTENGFGIFDIILDRDKEPEVRRANDVRHLNMWAGALARRAERENSTQLAELSEAVLNLAVYAGRCTSHDELERVIARRQRIAQLVDAVKKGVR